MNALLDQKQLARVVGLVGIKGGVELVQRRINVIHPLCARNRVGRGFGCRPLRLQRRTIARAPAHVVRVKLAQHMHQLGQHAHRVSA